MRLDNLDNLAQRMANQFLFPVEEPVAIEACDSPTFQEVLQGFRDEALYRKAQLAMMALPIVESPLTAPLVLEAVAKVEADKLTVVQTLATERGARTMAVDPLTHRVYLPTAEYGLAPAASAVRESDSNFR